MPAIYDKNKLFDSLDPVIENVIQLISPLSEATLNKIPFKNSWNTGQLLEHITRSNRAIDQALNMKGILMPGISQKKVDELRKIFLDFTVKFVSPDFIAPTQHHYVKESVLPEYETSYKQLKISGLKSNSFEIIDIPIFGKISKLELLYFVLFHTQRHQHQLEKIITYNVTHPSTSPNNYSSEII